MSSKRRKRLKGCRGKVKHPNHKAASATIGSLDLHGKKDGPLHAYRCKNCGFWHIGHPPMHIQKLLAAGLLW